MQTNRESPDNQPIAQFDSWYSFRIKGRKMPMP